MPKKESAEYGQAMGALTGLNGGSEPRKLPNGDSFALGNHALRDGRHGAAMRHYMAALQAAPHDCSAAQIASNLILARNRHRRLRRTGTHTVVVLCDLSLDHAIASKTCELAQWYLGISRTRVEVLGRPHLSVVPELQAHRCLWDVPIHRLPEEAAPASWIKQATAFVLDHPYDVVHLLQPCFTNIVLGAFYKLLWGARVFIDIDGADIARVNAGNPLSIEQWRDALVRGSTQHDAASAATKENASEGRVTATHARTPDPTPWLRPTEATATRLAMGLINAFDGITGSSPSSRARYSRVVIASSNDLQALIEATADAPASPALQGFIHLPPLAWLPTAMLGHYAPHPQGVSIIILTLDGAMFLERLLRSFFANNRHQPVELIVVDHAPADGSDDGTSAVIQAFAGQDIRHIRRGRNYSFSDSCNFAAGFARHPHLLFLNNDIHYVSDALPAAMHALRDPDIGLVGIRLDDDPSKLAANQSQRVQHLGVRFRWNPKRGYHQPEQIRHPSVQEFEAQQAAADRPHSIAGNRQPAVTGAFMLCRRIDFERLGGFSTDYNYGLEDIDLCLRAGRDLGKACWCITGLSLQHVEMATRRRDREVMNARIVKNHERFKAIWAGRTRQLARGEPVKVAVAVHVFYPELWPEIGTRLQEIRYPFDLYITTPSEMAEVVTTAVTEPFPAARIHTFPNQGMDVLPFLRLVPTFIANDYRAVCKLHTKRGEGNQGATWRRAMLEPLIGDSAIFQQVAEAFAGNSKLQLVGPAPLYQSARHLMLRNAPLVNELHRHLVGQELSGDDWGFFVGNMFWARPSALGVLAQLARSDGPLAEDRFDSSYERDGQLVHAVERVFGLLPRLQHGVIGLIHHARNGGWTLQVPEREPTPRRAFIRELIPQYEALERDVQGVRDASL